MNVVTRFIIICCDEIKRGKFSCLRNHYETTLSPNFRHENTKNLGNTSQNMLKNDFCTQIVYSLSYVDTIGFSQKYLHNYSLSFGIKRLSWFWILAILSTSKSTCSKKSKILSSTNKPESKAPHVCGLVRLTVLPLSFTSKSLNSIVAVAALQPRLESD